MNSLSVRLAAKKTTLAGILSMTFVFAATICAAQEQDSTNEVRAARVAKLNAKVSALKDQYKILKAKWIDAAGQAKANAEAELEEAARELAEAYKQREATYEAKLTEWAASLDSAWNDLQSKGELAQADATEKLNHIRDAWQASLGELKQSHQQRVEHYRGELISIEQQVASAADELNAEWIARRMEARKQYQQTSASMRESYLQAIGTLDSEINRLLAEAGNASAENKAKLDAIADSMSQQMNVFHQELESSYRETAERAQNYLDQTASRISLAGTEWKDTITAEVDEVSESICELGAEWTTCCERYSQALDQQLASLRQRVDRTKGETKRKLNELESELRSQSKIADEQIAYAYAAYTAALNADIDRLKQRVVNSDEKTRAALIKTIENRQAELEKAKQKLERRPDNPVCALRAS